MSRSVASRSGIDHAPNVIDLFVGARIRMRRIVLGLTEEELALMAGLTSNELQAYESGSQRLGVPRLHQLSQLLTVPISWFFSGLGQDGEVQFGGRMARPREMSDTAARFEQLESLRHCFEALSNDEHRQLVLQLAQVLSDCEARLVIDNTGKG